MQLVYNLWKTHGREFSLGTKTMTAQDYSSSFSAILEIYLKCTILHFSSGGGSFYTEFVKKFKVFFFKIFFIVMEQLSAKVVQNPTLRILWGNAKVLSSPAVSAWPCSCLQVKEGSIRGNWDLRFNESVFHHSFAVKLSSTPSPSHEETFFLFTVLSLGSETLQIHQYHSKLC